MGNLTIRFLIALITFIIGIIAASVWLFYPARKSESRTTQNLQSQNRSQEMLRVLMPNGIWADVTQLDRFDRFSLFRPLFDVSRKADGAFAQSLGEFYSDMLSEQPEQFLKALSPYPKNKQRGFCSSAGVEDGGGMNEERFRKIRQSLNGISDISLQPVARTCLRGLEVGYRQAMENNRSVNAN